MKAIWNDKVIAESDDTIIIEGNHYFPQEAINKEFFKKSETHTSCHWKGIASYYSVDVDGVENKDAAWYYPEASYAAKNIEGRIAFWRGVSVIGDR